MSPSRLRVGVGRELLNLSPRSGHGKVWHRVLSLLAEQVRVIPLDSESRRRRLVRRPRVDVVLADGHSDLPPTGGAPLVVQVHEAAWFLPELRELLDPNFVAHIAPRTERSVLSATRVITPSRSARQALIDAYGLAPARVVAAHHGADPAFHPAASDRRISDLTAAGPYILFAAMLHPRKNLGAVREATSTLAAEGFPHRLVIVGGPAADRPDSRDLEAAAVAELPGAPGRVIRVDNPRETELAALMAGAEVFCLPSLYEGFGLTVLEAMACGTVPVVSDRGALPEVVADGGVIVTPDAGAVTDAIRRLLEDPAERQRLGDVAERRARTLTWTATVQRWLTAIVEAVDAPATDHAP